MTSISAKSCEINEYREEQTQIIKEIEDFMSDITIEECISLKEIDTWINETEPFL